MPTAVLSRVVATVLDTRDVVVTEWVDARAVPLAAGPLTLDDQARIVADAILAAGTTAPVVAVSQAGLAALRALGLTAAAADGAPRRLALLGCPLDPRLDPAPAQRLVTSLPDRLIEEHLLLTVPAGHPGAGRRVFAAFLQLLTVASTSPAQYVEIQGGLLLELLGLVRMGYDRQHEDLHALLDVPAELFLDLVAFLRIGDDAALAAALGLPAGAAPLSLLTVEAGGDALVGAGQSHAAVNLLRPAVLHHERLTVPGAAHHDLFVGPQFERVVRPALLRFLG
jgi:polyhydroxyalkanoate depolymerase